MTIRIALAGLMTAAAALALSLAARAEPVVKEKIVTYEVGGASPAEVRANLNRLGPLSSSENRRYDSETRWYVRWRYRYANRAGGCTIATIRVSVEINITMPKLAVDSSTPPELVHAFDSYKAKLLVHEMGHVTNGVDTARRVETEIRNHPPKPTCGELERSANALGKKIVTEEGNKFDVDYDARTLHGRSQGATFP